MSGFFLSREVLRESNNTEVQKLCQNDWVFHIPKADGDRFPSILFDWTVKQGVIQFQNQNDQSIERYTTDTDKEVRVLIKDTIGLQLADLNHEDDSRLTFIEANYSSLLLEYFLNVIRASLLLEDEESKEKIEVGEVKATLYMEEGELFFKVFLNSIKINLGNDEAPNLLGNITSFIKVNAGSFEYINGEASNQTLVMLCSSKKSTLDDIKKLKKQENEQPKAQPLAAASQAQPSRSSSDVASHSVAARTKRPAINWGRWRVPVAVGLLGLGIAMVVVGGVGSAASLGVLSIPGGVSAAIGATLTAKALLILLGVEGLAIAATSAHLATQDCKKPHLFGCLSKTLSEVRIRKGIQQKSERKTNTSKSKVAPYGYSGGQPISSPVRRRSKSI